MNAKHSLWAAVRRPLLMALACGLLAAAKPGQAQTITGGPIVPVLVGNQVQAMVCNTGAKAITVSLATYRATVPLSMTDFGTFVTTQILFAVDTQVVPPGTPQHPTCVTLHTPVPPCFQADVLQSVAGSHVPLQAIFFGSELRGFLIRSDATCGPCLPGRFTGGGSLFTSDGTRVTHGMELRCGVTGPSNLEINWSAGGTENNFHLESIEECCIFQMADGSFCINGIGTGKLNGVSGVPITFTFCDAGEPGVNDFASITISGVLSVSGTLDNGNTQYHPAH